MTQGEESNTREGQPRHLLAVLESNCVESMQCCRPGMKPISVGGLVLTRGCRVVRVRYVGDSGSHSKICFVPTIFLCGVFDERPSATDSQNIGYTIDALAPFFGGKTTGVRVGDGEPLRGVHAPAGSA